MTDNRTHSTGLEALGGGAAVASALVVLARWLPLEFAYQPNSLGIVSATTRLGYPSHQEPIFYVLFGALGVLGGWLAAAALGRRALSLPNLIVLELQALAALASALLLPRGVATGVVAVLLAGVAVLAARAERVPAAPVRSRARGFSAGLVAAIVTLAALRVSRLFEAAYLVAARIPDERLTRNDWVFQSEDGQHVAWADALQQGLLHGRDFFCLYGPLYDWSVVGMWKLVGRSLAGWHLHVGVTEFLAWAAFLTLAASLLSRRWLLLGLVLLTPHVSLRIGLPIAALFFLVRFLRARKTRDAGLAGIVIGISLLYSQEFGMAALLSAVLVHAVARSPRAMLASGVGVVASMAPVLLYYAAQGALGPMLGDLAGYPAAVSAGYGNLPFPSLPASLPWRLALDPEDTRFLRMGLALGAISVLGLALSLPRIPIHPRSPLRWIRALLDDWAAQPDRFAVAVVAFFGLVAYRTALGRSDAFHLFSCTATAFLLIAIAVDRLLDRLRDDRALVALQLGLGAFLLVGSGLATGAGGAALFHLEATAATLGRIATGGIDPRGNGAVNRVVEWLEANSEPDDRFYFLPNDAALYYLTRRPPTTRWVVSHQMVTEAYRQEAFADLRAAPPRYVVWNDATLRVDEIGDEIILGPALWEWLHASYEPVKRVGGMRIWEHRGAQDRP